MKKFNLVVMLALMTLTGIVSAETYNCPMGGGYGGMMYGGYGSSVMIFGWLISLLVIALIIAAIYWLVKNANRKR